MPGLRAHCTVGCDWCDTRYAWPEDGGRDGVPAAWIAEALALGAAPLLVVTGGEPLESGGLRDLLERSLDHWARVEVETSGIAPPPLSHPRLFYNVSPKLPSATRRWEETWRAAPAWIAEPNATFKLVVGDAPDDADAVRLIAAHRLPAARVMLMPEGVSDERVRAHAATVAALCRAHGWRMSPRLHVWLWGARRGV
ncbi:MAG: 7-carboxy-7-deazaguanine synthase QueE [Candidatus Eisenbacteria bacterium]|uniref:7-carboxy-7-deazaguanine synthase QueE n=1 Tax=Eiseniibacteriota bacterium TaxID=2212470 RepID=A0A9D6QM12_UNCEI|nr:7-carboxy-7-deazaguanine synthase QueE [Candidatus Eisenbacteria bacterium]